MDLISRSCARCGGTFEHQPGAKGQSQSWCAPCRRAYNREYKRDYGLRNGATNPCTSCGGPCWGVRCRTCYDADRVKKLRKRTPRPARASSNPRNDPRLKALREIVLAEETHCGICGELVDKSLRGPHKMS